MEIKPLTGALGAEIFGADLRKPEDVEGIKAAFARYSVLVLRNQSITPDDHLAFARHFGEINVNRFFKALDSHPSIAVVLKEPDQTLAIGEIWHTDHSYDEIPAMGSILHAIDMPAVGGDTAFASMSAAYDALSKPLQRLLDGLSAWHGTAHVFGSYIARDMAKNGGRVGNAEGALKPDIVHPMVIRHPLSGRKCIYVNPQFTTRIEGVSELESKGILETVYAHCREEQFQCRIRWQVGDVTLWDNRATWHKAINDYNGQRRYMHRVTVEGCALDAG